jgi:hypothetical protein
MTCEWMESHCVAIDMGSKNREKKQSPTDRSRCWGHHRQVPGVLCSLCQCYWVCDHGPVGDQQGLAHLQPLRAVHRAWGGALWIHHIVFVMAGSSLVLCSPPLRSAYLVICSVVPQLPLQNTILTCTALTRTPTHHYGVPPAIALRCRRSSKPPRPWCDGQGRTRPTTTGLESRSVLSDPAVHTPARFSTHTCPPFFRS